MRLERGGEGRTSRVGRECLDGAPVALGEELSFVGREGGVHVRDDFAF